MNDDGLDIWIGRMGKDRALRKELGAAIARAGRTSKGRSKFTGKRIGRGHGTGAIAASRQLRFTRRVIVKARIVRLGGKGLGAAKAHLRYLERDGTTRDGGRGTLYGNEHDAVDGKEFLERGAEDRHQFRFIVAPEDGAEFDDLKPFVRNLMHQVEQDLGTRLDWVAVDHFNTGHPHSHVIVRGKDELGKDLVIAPNYLSHGMRERATELIELQLGPRSEAEIRRSQLKEIEQQRWTSIDRRLVNAIGEDGLVRPVHRDGIEQSLRAGRLQILGRLGLAQEVMREDGIDWTIGRRRGLEIGM